VRREIERRLGPADGAVAGWRDGDEEGGGVGVEREDRVRLGRRAVPQERPVGDGGVARQEDGAVAGEAERVGNDGVAAPAGKAAAWGSRKRTGDASR
jgi:hypothetical protein